MSTAGEVEALICTSWKRLWQCYSTTSTKKLPFLDNYPLIILNFCLILNWGVEFSKYSDGYTGEQDPVQPRRTCQPKIQNSGFAFFFFFFFKLGQTQTTIVRAEPI